jgi:hypothetical protein
MASTLDYELVIGVAVIIGTAAVGLSTASDYGISIDEFNADDYGPKALAWYTSGFEDRSQFETVEFSLWYYGPWFHMLTAFVQSLSLGDRFAVRHAMTFMIGLSGVAAVLPIGRAVGRRWSGLTALVLCLTTGYLYGSLFFTPIDVPFLAAMTWAILAIALTSLRAEPSWILVIAVGLSTGLAIATRTGGVITYLYALTALALCAARTLSANGELRVADLGQLALKFAVIVLVSGSTAIVLWPWLQIGNPIEQFLIAYRHFVSIPMSYDFPHWGKLTSVSALPRLYIPEQLAARLPAAFLIFILLGFVFALERVFAEGHTMLRQRGLGARHLLFQSGNVLARHSGILLVALAGVLPIAFLIVERMRIYDGIRHVLFIIPMLAILAGVAAAKIFHLLARARLLLASLIALYIAEVVLTFSRLHPLEYVAMSSIAGGTKGAYKRFELDYFTVAATEAVRRLEARLDYEGARLTHPLSIMICIPWREWAVKPMLKRNWLVQTTVEKADFVVETERWRCAEKFELRKIDEVRRMDKPFAWTYTRVSELP